MTSLAKSNVIHSFHSYPFINNHDDSERHADYNKQQNAQRMIKNVDTLVYTTYVHTYTLTTT